MYLQVIRKPLSSMGYTALGVESCDVLVPVDDASIVDVKSAVLKLCEVFKVLND